MNLFRMNFEVVYKNKIFNSKDNELKYIFFFNK